MSGKKQKILILGATGMLGNAMLKTFSNSQHFENIAAIRSRNINLQTMFPDVQYITGLNASDPDSLIHVFAQSQADIIINCIGLIKQLASGKEIASATPINTLLPHRLAQLAKISNARIIHFSTDCVFSGNKGNYTENDPTDATDVYGLTKYLGEIHYDNSLTIRTSIIGHELHSSNGLIDWFLNQTGNVSGYTKAIFSGLPTAELARIVRDYIIPNPQLSGLYHVSAEPIAKYDLLKLVSDIYGHGIEINPSDKLVIDRSLNSSRFRSAVGYKPPPWPELVKIMQQAK